MFFDNLLVNNINNITCYIRNANFVLQNIAIFFMQRINLQFDNKLNCMKKFAKISISVFVVLGLVFLLFVGGIFVYINTAKSNVYFDKTMLDLVGRHVAVHEEIFRPAQTCGEERRNKKQTFHDRASVWNSRLI